MPPDGYGWSVDRAKDDLTSMSPWRGIPVLTSAQFVQRTDVMRRAR